MKKRFSKVLMALFFCMLGTIMIATSAITASAAETTTPASEETTVLYSGACGTNLTWQIDDAGTLTINGTGAMETYSYGSAPWYAYRSRITKIVVNNGITSISNGAFYGCSSLKELSIPFVGGSAATNVENGASYYKGYSSRTYVIGYIFGWSTSSSYDTPSGTVYQGYGCYGPGYSTDGSSGYNSYYNGKYYADYFYIPSSLTKVTITGSSAIAYGAFHNCTSIKEIVIANTVTKIGDYAFKNCSKLATFTLPTNLTTLGDHALDNCDGIKSLTIPSGVTTINDYAFYDCDALTDITMHSNITSIGNYAFYSCGRLKNVELPSNLQSIGNYAFEYCSSFTNITIPSKVTSIGNYAFSNCSYVSDVTIGNSVKTVGSYAFQNLSKITEIVFPNSVTSIGEGTLYGCTSLKELSIPFVGGSATTSVSSTSSCTYVLGYIFGWYQDDAYSFSDAPSGTVYQGYGCYSSGYTTDGASGKNSYYDGKYYADYFYIPSSLTKVTITGSSAIAYGAFHNCTSIKEIVIADTVTKIGDYAFKNCSKLDTFSLPKNLTALGGHAFDNCDSLTDIEIPLGVTSIQDYTFNSCNALSNIKLHSNITNIGDYAFYGCNKLKNVDLPENLTTIGDYAFANCSSFTQITIPNKVTAIDTYAFSDCSNVLSVTIGNSVKTIGSNAFQNLSKITELVFPNSVTSIGSSALYGCTSLKELSIPFVGGSATTSVSSTSSRTYVLGYIFGWYQDDAYSSNAPSGTVYQGYGCYGPGYSTDGSSGYNSYYNGKYYADYFYIPSSLTKVTITGSSAIAYGAFHNCTSIKEIVIADTVTKIGDYAFKNFGVVNSSKENMVISNHILLAYKGTESNVIIPEDIKIIAPRAFYENKKVGTVTLADATNYIGAYAFYNCTSTLVNVPRISGTLTIESNGFTNTASVKYLDKSSYTNGNDTYYYTVDGEGNAVIVGCSTTSSNITLPNTLGGYTVTTVGYKGMANCTTLKGVTIPNNIVKLDLYAFAGCTKLDTATIPATCVYVGQYAFSGCTSLTTVVIAEGVTYLGDYCFENCTSLTEIVVPDSCTYLGDYAFYNCRSMESATIGITVPAIGKYTFYNCEKLATAVIGIKVESIGDYAFYNTALTRLTTPTSLKHIGDYAFASCDVLERVSLKTGLLTIGDGAFMGDVALTTINWTANINCIGAYAFHGCSSLASATIPAGVTEIKDYTFAYCTSLASVTVKGTLTSIGEKAFYRDALTAFTFTEGLTTIGADAFAFNALEAITLPNSLVYIGEQAFNECSSLATVSMPDSVTYVGAYAFSADADNLTVTIRYNSGKIADYMLYNMDVYKVVMENGISEIGNYVFALCHELTEITFPNTLKTIGNYAFYDNRMYDELTLPNTVETIGNYAFARGYRFVKINIPDSVQSIGTHAFYREEANDHIDPQFTVHIYYNKGILCDNILDGQDMHHVIVGDYIHTIGNNAFSNCSNLLDVSLPDTIKHIGTDAFLGDDGLVVYIRYVEGTVYDGILSGCYMISEIYVEDNVFHIGDNVFYGCKGASIIELPDTIRYIGEYALYDCNSLLDLNIAFGVEKILSHTFYGCASLGSIEVPNSVIAIEDYAFYGCVVAKSITLSNQCKTIGEAAFYNCKALTKLNIPDSVTSIGAYAFRSCGGITELVFSDNVDKIGACAFYDCNGLKTVKLGKKIIELGDRMFYGCVNLESLYVYAPLSYIDELAFYGADYVTVYCGLDDYMIEFFDENGIMYEILEGLVYQYKITFVTDNGEIISSGTYDSGSTITAPANPTKSADSTYTYVFAGWDQEVTIVGGNKTYTASFTPVYIEYTVVFKDYNGNTISSGTYHYGDTVTAPSDPTRAADNTYTYAFAGWDNAVVECAGDATYTATYTPTYIEYTVVFKDYDGEIISSNTYHYGDVVTAPSNPVREADLVGTYSFKSWGNAVVACAGDATYTAVYDIAYIDYTVVFKDHNGDVISAKTYHYGDSIIVPTNPTREADNTYTYAFAGWDNAVVECAGNAVYTATYTPTYIEYTVVFKDYDGETISTKDYHYGDAIDIPSDPTRAADNTYTYAFAGWNTAISTTCDGNKEYKATYTPTYIEYTVVFEDYNGDVISTEKYHYGDSVTAPTAPTRESDIVGSYTFKAWDKAVVACAGNTTYTATYDISYTNYTVVFKNYNGDVLSTEIYHYGETVIVPSAPSKPADETYTYTFIGWDKTVTTCEGDAIYTAKFAPTNIEYTVVFKNADGTVISTNIYYYGATVVIPSNPTKAADNTYTYTFAGWDKEVVDCVADATYIATYTPVYINYTITFTDYDGTEIKTVTYHYGETIVAIADPTRASDETYTYTFNGWDKPLGACKGNATFKATYTSTYIDYTVIFENEDGTVLSRETYHYGDKIVAPGTPSKASNNTYTYTFAGWDKSVGNCTGEATFTATYNANYINYTVIFKNEDGKVLSTKTYHYGEKVTEPATPTKAADNTFTYTFKAWDKTVIDCAGDVIYTATYDADYINYTVIFENADGTVLSTNTYHYGEKVTEPATPTKAADNTYTYTFKAWDKTVVDCAGDVTYTATYDVNYINYTVIFKDEDGTVLSTKTYHYGEKVTEPATPTKAADNTYTYTFAGWDKAVVACDGDEVYTATYTSAYIEYTVVFKDWNGNEISSDEYHYGQAVTKPRNPTRAADSTYTYTFAGWDKTVTNCTASVVYTATYSSTYIDYEIVFKNYDNSIISKNTYHYGDPIVVPEDPTKPADASYTYGFAGWDSEVTACLGSKTYTATFNPTNVEYTVVFKDWNGNEISSEIYHFGDSIVVPNAPSRDADITYTYTFKDWGKTVAETCVGDAEYTAVYTATYIEYNIKFLDWDGTLIQTVKYHYGDTITAIADPERESDETYTYTFLSWNKALGTCTGNASFTAQYESTFINYTVVFKDYDGSVISRKTYHFGDTITIPADPIRASDDTYSYTFKNWGNISTSCNGNKDYTAVYKEEYIDYTVIFKDHDGSEISTQTYHFGDTVTAPQNPKRAADNTYTYAFAGWNKTVVACDGDATYTATYTPTFIDYTVEFKDYDGEVISTETYHYGDAITVPTAPTRESDAIASYTFKAWNNTVVNCAGDATYTATYEITYTDYTVIFKNEDGTVLSTNTYHYGDEVTAPSTPTKDADNTYTYTFKAWDAEVVNCAGDATYTATYDSAYIDYTVIFKNEDGTVLNTNTYHYGDEVTAPSTPTKDADNTYTYTFKAWDAEVVNCAGDATYTATYDSAYIDYTVIFKNEDGTVLSTNTYHYGDEVVIPAEPSKDADDRYSYAFAGWDKDVVVCDGDTTYIARYTSTEIESEVIQETQEVTETQKIVETDTEEPKEQEKTASGCSGVIGSSSLGLILLISAGALMLNKKRE